MTPLSQILIRDIRGKIFRDDLTDFLVGWLQNGSPVPAVPYSDGHSVVEGVSAIVLYRAPPYQIQLFIIAPNTLIPMHSHPNVDSYEMFLGGIHFTHGAETISPGDEKDFLDPTGVSLYRGALARVKPGDTHGGVASPQGGSFISVQKWLNGIPPTTVGADWSGVNMGAAHDKLIEERK